MSDLPDHLPWETRIPYTRLLMEQRPARRDHLTARVAAYLAHLEAAVDKNAVIDQEAAKGLGSAILKLIEQCPEHHAAHLQAAVSYFVHSDDAEHDFDSGNGFDDDIGVFNAVCDHVGLPQLKVLS